MKTLYILLSLILVCSCGNVSKNDLVHLVNEWDGREIVFPNYSDFTVLGKDSVFLNYLGTDYKILSYNDSTGCTACKLQLSSWLKFIYEVDSIVNKDISFVFYFFPKDVKDLRNIIIRENFNYPVCIDEFDEFNTLNNFPKERAFQTFLLNKENRVVAIGNPILNPKVKELYLKIISGDTSRTTPIGMTKVVVEPTKLDFGNFVHSKTQKQKITLTNEGEVPLVIQDIITSCGCTKVEYDKEPVSAGNQLELTVVYEAEKAEYFNKTITIHCNAKSSPIVLKITGNAE